MSKMNEMAITIEELRNAVTAINDTANWLAQQFSSESEYERQIDNTATISEEKISPH